MRWRYRLALLLAAFLVLAGTLALQAEDPKTVGGGNEHATEHYISVGLFCLAALVAIIVVVRMSREP